MWPPAVRPGPCCFVSLLSGDVSVSNIIQRGEKYGLVALPTNFVHSAVPPAMKLADGLWATRALPAELADHWRKWIGSLLADRIEKAELFLVATGPSKAPEILDGENVELQHRVGHLYWGLLVATSIRTTADPVQMTGAFGADGIDVRQMRELDSPRWVPGAPECWITCALLQEAADLERMIAHFDPLPKKPLMNRFDRVLQAFSTGVNHHAVEERLHQFVRCVEGFILPDIGSTESQFKSRTELFLGPRHHSLIEQLYRIRSAVEHLHDPLNPITAASAKTQIRILFQRAYEAEALARYCVKRLLLSPDLRPHFADDKTLAAFWALPKEERARLWGFPLDMNLTSSGFNPAQIGDGILGLP